MQRAMEATQLIYSVISTRAYSGSAQCSCKSCLIRATMDRELLEGPQPHGALGNRA